jgi:hypothetical protein
MQNPAGTELYKKKGLNYCTVDSGHVGRGKGWYCESSELRRRKARHAEVGVCSRGPSDLASTSPQKSPVGRRCRAGKCYES